MGEPRGGAPQRLLVLSATIGEGHNATAEAVEEQARRLWPGCHIVRRDTLRQMGRWVGPGFRWIYRVNVDTTPWLYDFFYRALERHRWFATASCRVVGAWSGRALAPLLAAYRPDLVVSTYPLGTGGLDWTRRRGGLRDVPVVAFISDIAPHPFWVYSEIDLHYVASEPSLRTLHRVRPDARGAVGAPPVVSVFRPGEPAEARRRCGLPDDPLVVLVSCGSLGFGAVERAVDAALRAGPRVCVVVTCGHNAALRARLAARGEPADRLVALGWTSQMPALTTAADVVVNNAGGATALQAVACGRAVLLFEPIAGHGRANAALMAEAGLATVCERPGDLTAALCELAGDRARLDAAQRRALDHVAALDLGAEIAALPGLPRHQGARPLPAADAFFVHAATPAVPQQVGAVLALDERHPVPPEDLVRHLAGLVTERAPALPVLRRRLQPRRVRRPRWVPEDDLDPARHVDTRTVGGAHGAHGGRWDGAIAEFFAAPLPLDRPPWRLRVLHDAGTGRTAVLAAMHHALGDGLAVTAALRDLLADGARPAGGAEEPPTGGTGWRERARHGRRVLRGVASLARSAVTSRGPVVAPGPDAGATSTAARHFAQVELPASKVRAVAREHRVSTTALLLALVGEALHRHRPAGYPPGARVRVMVPRTTRTVRRGGGGGNRTAAVALELPVGAMPPARRVAEVAAGLTAPQRADQPVAAQAVLGALGRLPTPLQARLVRAVYGRRFFGLIASVLPGPRTEQRIAGTPVVSVYPVLPLADGVGLAVGFLSWGRTLGVGITADPGVFPAPDRLTDALRYAFDDVVAGGTGEPGDVR